MRLRWDRSTVDRRSKLALLMGLLALSIVAGCENSGGPGEKARAPELAPLPTQWTFASREGAVRYRVQAWAERRLLFELTVEDTVVALTPALARAAQPFADIVLELRALDEQGALVGEVWREALPTRSR